MEYTADTQKYIDNKLQQLMGILNPSAVSLDEPEIEGQEPETVGHMTETTENTDNQTTDPVEP